MRETPITRRVGLALGLSAAALLWLPAKAAPLAYPLAPVEIAPRVWTIYGAPEPITRANGGAIANTTVLDTSDGAVLIDAGPSHRYGMQLATMSKLLTGKPVARVYITHIHSDHSLGATAFPAETLWGPPGLAADLKLRGNDITNAMYRVAGDWMRDTNAPDIPNVAKDGAEQIGERKFHAITLAGHTKQDLCYLWSPHQRLQERSRHRFS